MAARTVLTEARSETPEDARQFPDLPEYLTEVVGAVQEHDAFHRLSRISFLGALSPRYHSKLDMPSCLLKHFSSALGAEDDGTRADHSNSVAYIAFLMAVRLNLSKDAQRYAVIWGLLHDIATWSLSHTGEAAFIRLTDISTHKLRTMMITGSRELPEHLNFKNVLSRIGICDQTLLFLFSNESHRSVQGGNDLEKLWLILHSPLNPDTLEGIWRCGNVFDKNVPSPQNVIQSFSNTLLGAVLEVKNSEYAFRFWRNKRDIYSTIINCASVTNWESKQSQRIMEKYNPISLGASLELSEDELLDCIMTYQIDTMTPELRYKAPRKYFLGQGSTKKRKLRAEVNLNNLDSVFRSEILEKHV